MGNLKDFVVNSMFPARCNFCGHALKQGEKGICEQCERDLPWLNGPESEQRLADISLCASALWLEGKVFDSIRRYKFKNCSAFANTYGRIIARCVKEHADGRYSMITWVPLSEESLRKRGYDQAMLIALAAALELDDVAVEMLQKGKNTSAQIDIKDTEQRKENVSGAYEVTDPELVDGQKILLVDDVVTTGSTLSECARTLRASGATDVVCVTLARAHKGELTPGELDKDS